MSILLNKDSKILVQGITGRSGLFHTQQCRDYGSQLSAGVTPGKGGIISKEYRYLIPWKKLFTIPRLMYP